MNSLDVIVIFVILAMVMAVGYISQNKSRNTQNKSEEFLLAGKSINKVQTGFSMAATDFGGSGLVAAIGYCYTVGMSGIWWNLAAAPAFLFVGLYLAGKINRMDSTTVPEYLGNRYSQRTRYLATAMHVLTNIAALSVQYTVACAVLYSITGFNENVSLIISVLLILLLTSGGLRTVINTDSILFVIIVISIAITLPLTVNATGGLEKMIQIAPAGSFSIGKLGFWTPFSWVLLCMLNYSTNQNYVQRMVAAKNEGTARFGACFTAGFYLVISVCIGLIGIAASLTLTGIEDTNTVFPEILRSYFPHGLLAIGVTGVFAATVSTGTSLLHSTTTLFVNDILVPLSKQSYDDNKRLHASKAVIIVIAAFSTILSLYSSNIINVLYISGLFYGVSVFFPMILGMRSEKITSAAASASIIITVICSLLWEYVISAEIPSISFLPSNLIGLIVSFTVLLIVSRFERHGKREV